MSAVEQINANVNKERGLLRFITAGSVDDGKSTLIGRLLFDSKGILRISSMQFPAPNISAPSETIDLSLLTDGLEAEREQGITIDVAYRYFATPNVNSSSRTHRVTSNTHATW
jgi:sulfate adenylyltransferase subunit 1